MAHENYSALRNDTYVCGVACDGIANEPITLTTEIVEKIAKAFCVWLISHTGKTQVCIAVGYDSRTTSPAFCEAVVKGITSTGHDAVVTGLSTTPSMFALLKDEKAMAQQYCHGSIMITASHLPFNCNGLKFFSHNGYLEGSDVKELLELAANYRFAEPTKTGKTTSIQYLNDYAANLVEKVRAATGEETPLQGKKIIVDAGNGVGGFFVDKVLMPLGADTQGSQFLNPDGTFPNHIPNPENAEAIRSLCEAVKNVQADFGILFDTDVNKAGAVDNTGAEINRNRLIALISAILLSEKPGTIVTDSVTSEGLKKFIQAKGGKHLRFKDGYKNVINESIRLNESGEYSPLAIETSGHAALKENYFLDDGAYLMVRLLIAMAKENKEGRALTDLIADLEMPTETAELRLTFKPDCDFKTLGKELITRFNEYAEDAYYTKPADDNYEGIRIYYDDTHGDGWLSFRLSLHDPVLSINVESNSKNGVVKMVKDLYYFFRRCDFLDLTPLQTYIETWRENKKIELKQQLEYNGMLVKNK
jgi:phosphomannomutase